MDKSVLNSLRRGLPRFNRCGSSNCRRWSYDNLVRTEDQPTAATHAPTTMMTISGGGEAEPVARISTGGGRHAVNIDTIN